jgi:carbamate kinase
MKEDAGRGFRRVVPSPVPINIIEMDAIKTLINNNHVVITCGGGGIPVIKDKNKLIGVDAVIDKDYASSLLASSLNADILLILTAIDHVMINFNKDNQTELKDVSLEEIKHFLQNNEFASGSMEPKIKAGITFLEAKPFGTVIITSLGHAEAALNGDFGTRIKNKRRVK